MIYAVVAAFFFSLGAVSLAVFQYWQRGRDRKYGE